MRDNYTILVDTREKVPLIFPEHLVVLDPSRPPTDRATRTVTLTTRREILKAGDYQLEGGGSTIIERKGSLFELGKNLLSPDRARAIAALEELQRSCPLPVLLLEGHPTILCGKRADLFDPPLPGGVVVDALLRAIRERPPITLLWLPADTYAQRRSVGEWAARLLIAGAL